MLTKERLEEMESLFWAESNDPETEEWRESLTDEEAAIVAQWDERVDAGITTLLYDLSKIV